MSRRLIWLGVVVLIGALAATLLRPAETLMRHLAGQITVAGPGLTRTDRQDSGEDSVDTSGILAFAPFGSAARPEATEASDAAAPRLDLVLNGVLVAPEEGASRALILVSGRGGFYRIGDEVAPGAVLVSIAADTVDVEAGGELQTYGFDGLVGDDASAGTQVAEADPESTEGSARDRLRAALVPGRGSLDLREAPPAETTQEYISLWRQRIIENPESVLETIGLEPGPDGYTIKQDPNVGVTLAGLRPGDVVARVNGQSVGDPEQDKSFYDEVAASGHARLEIVRGGEKILMSFPLR